MSPELPHFVEPDRLNPVAPHDRMPEEVYRAALDHLVIACVDVVLTHQGQVFLLKRDRYPHPSWWVLGGRMVAGESPQAAALRKLKQDVHLEGVEATRLHKVGVYSTCFAKRHQAPQENGSHTLNITYQLELTAEELEKLVWNPAEYRNGQWVDRNQVAPIFDRLEIMERALLRVLQDLPQ